MSFLPQNHARCEFVEPRRSEGTGPVGLLEGPS
jgi:hypothetical protein